MRTQSMLQKNPQDLSSRDLHAVALREAGNASLEAYAVVIGNNAERAEVLYLGDRDIAGVAWGADAAWHEGVLSAHHACLLEWGGGLAAYAARWQRDPGNNFAVACYDQNTIAELLAALEQPQPDTTDMAYWRLTQDQEWYDAIGAAVAERGR